jgi:sec-independent protein translocase protein TatA
MTPYLGFGIPGGPELWVILAIVLLLFGHRIPGMARNMGSGITEFKRGLKGDPDTPRKSGGSDEPRDPAGPDSEKTKG